MAKTRLPSLEQWIAYFREQAQCGTPDCAYPTMHQAASVILGEAELLLQEWYVVGETTPEIDEKRSALQNMILEYESTKFMLGAEEYLFQVIELVSSIDVGVMPDTPIN